MKKEQLVTVGDALGRNTGLVLILLGTVLILYAALQALSIVMSPEGRGKLPSFLLIPSIRNFLKYFTGDTRDIVENCLLAAFLLLVEGIGVGLIALGMKPFSGRGAGGAVSGKP